MSRRAVPPAPRSCHAFFLAFLVPAFAYAQNSPNVQTPAVAKQVMSLGDEMQRPGIEPLHLIYMHGIGATGPGDSEQLRKSICAHVKTYVKEECTTAEGEPKGREYADDGIFEISKGEPDLAYMGTRVWGSPEQWHAAAPFVDHYLIKLKSGKSILVDELNWWPLVMAVKCQHMMPNETYLAGRLSGKDDNYLSICAQAKPHVGDNVIGRFDSYDWITAAGLNLGKLEKTPNRAVIVNRIAKVDLLDWRFSDAALGVGPMEGYLVEGIRQLLMKCVETGSVTTTALTSKTTPLLDPDAHYITVSHSLGSFLIFSALHAEYSPEGEKFGGADDKRTEVFDYLLGHLSQAYLFANQIPLLELAKLGSVSSKSFLDLEVWSNQRKIAKGLGSASTTELLGQIISWSDPNDLLTWYLGGDFQAWQTRTGSGISVVNNIVKNSSTWNWLWLFENPGDAHDNYAKNPKIIRSILKPLGFHLAP
jgi:hypothetical protein